MTGRVRTREWSGVDYYAELGIAPGVSRAAVDEAFRRQAKALHPDRNPEATAEDRFKRLSAAYEVLRDPATRRAYDEFRFRVDDGPALRRADGSGSVPPGAGTDGDPAGPGTEGAPAAAERPTDRDRLGAGLPGRGRGPLGVARAVAVPHAPATRAWRSRSRSGSLR